MAPPTAHSSLIVCHITFEMRPMSRAFAGGGTLGSSWPILFSGFGYSCGLEAGCVDHNRCSRGRVLLRFPECIGTFVSITPQERVQCGVCDLVRATPWAAHSDAVEPCWCDVLSWGTAHRA